MSRPTLRKAMILAAGRGERLRPLTDTLPKPMLPVGGRPILDYGLQYLKSQGIEEVVINLWHLGDRIKRHARQGHSYGLKIHYSEEPELLGSGGGLKAAEKYLRGESVFVLMNGVILIDCLLPMVLQRHNTMGAAATMVLMERSEKEPHTPIEVRKDQIVSIGSTGGNTGGNTGNYFYTGLALFGPGIFSCLPEGRPSCLVEAGLKPMLAAGKTIAAYLHRGQWRKIFDYPSYQKLQEEWASLHLTRQP